jgi:type III restriction enzyme
MALHPKFPTSPYEVVDPEYRWFPADEQLREKGYEKLLPPLVAELRKKVKAWRDAGYEGATETSSALLRWWFQTDHPMQNDAGETFLFQYYFPQREAVETVIYLHEIAHVQDKYDLLRFDNSGAVSAGMFDEAWRRFVVKMATGSGKTKVLSLLLAWSFFHKTYEEGSTLARNFLLIAPNIIVLDRLRTDFDGLKIFFTDPMLPDNGYEGRDWRSAFQLTLHIQDDIGVVPKTGNLFLTNIHRVYEGDESAASFDDEDTASYFLGSQPVASTTQSKVNLSDIVRDIDELVVMNDEAHHVHDPKLAWFKSIEDIHNRLVMKGSGLAMQIDVTATPKRTNGAIFVQTVSDYPLVEAIYQNVVKHPVLPDVASRGKLTEHQSIKFTERYREYIHLGYLEWQKVREVHAKVGKKAVLFVMTDDTRNCDDVAEYLQSTYSEFADPDSVLVIHTKNNGEVAENVTGKKEDELRTLRAAANSIDQPDSPYKAIVSVLMLKEGWDVRNVTTIVGLRAYSAQANILPEQTLGRGLRRMYREAEVAEEVSVVGTEAFMQFVESIKSEGVELEHKPMGPGTQPKAPLLVEVDRENLKKDIDTLDIEIPVLTPRIYREYKNLSDLEVAAFGHRKVSIQTFSEEEKRAIRFEDVVSGEESHATEFDGTVVTDGRSVARFFTQAIANELRLVGGQDILYEKVKAFIQHHLFETAVDLDDLNMLRNLSEVEAKRTIIETFKKAINDLTVVDKGEAEIRDYIKVSRTRPFVVRDQGYVVPNRSLFNRIVGDSHFELEIAGFLDHCEDIVSFVKNFFAVHFRIDYRTADGSIADYYPDFIVKVSNREYYVLETKGREDLDDIEKIKRLRQWCEDVNASQSRAMYKALYLKQEVWEKLEPRPTSLGELVRALSV